MTKFVFPHKAIEELPAEVKTYLLLLISHNIERQLNENAGRSYREHDINAKLIAEVLAAVEVEDAEDEENADSGHTTGHS